MKPQSHAVQELERYIDQNFNKEDRRALYTEAARFAKFKADELHTYTRCKVNKPEMLSNEWCFDCANGKVSKK